MPLLEMDDGSRLSNVAAILQNIADRKPGTLAPAFGSMEHYRGTGFSRPREWKEP